MTATDSVEHALQRVLDGLVARRSVGHAVVAVEDEDRSFRWLGAAGDADGHGRPLTETTPFHLAGITKMHTATVTLKLHERGVVRLDTPIAGYLPPSVTHGLHRLGGVDHTPDLTVRHLLANTSGLANYFEDRPDGGRSLAERLFVEGDRGWTVQDVADMVRDQLKPHFAPGRGVRYSDTNYQLLGAIIEAACGRPLHEVFSDDLIGPLGLRTTYMAGYPPLPASPKPAALFFQGRPLDVPRAMESVGAQGGLVSTVEDSFTFIRALVAGEVFAKRETLSLMQAEWNRFGRPLDRTARRAPGWPIEYGLGLMRFRLPRLLNQLRPMPVVIGHTGSSGSWLFHAPERRLYLAGTVDEVTSGAVPYRVVPRLLRILEQLPAS